jgi:2-polyprenyl-3-methyl-5-hydroxy-6-metoxy-1,4-benzoquinol methylase
VSIDPADRDRLLAQALQRIHARPRRPAAWQGDNLPWEDPAFSSRMLREHLDESHDKASRRSAERALHIDWLWRQLALQPGAVLLDVTCGPGLYAVPLARRGVRVTGIDCAPAAIDHARTAAAEAGVGDRCTFLQEDVRRMQPEESAFDAAVLLYSMLGSFPANEARDILERIARGLKPGGLLALEHVNPERHDHGEGTWWNAEDGGIWGDGPILQLGEYFWDEETSTTTERYTVIHLETGAVQEVVQSVRVYSPAELTAMLVEAGFAVVHVHAGWEELPGEQADRRLIYVARRVEASRR